MSVQTSFLQDDGSWVTRDVSIQELVRKNAAPKQQKKEQLRPPQYGILTKSVVESPVTNWILPVRLRSAHKCDVAFVGDHYVQIHELRRDGQLHHVIRKNDLGSRIRNAKVIGSLPDDIKAEDGLAGAPIKSDFDNAGTDFPSGLPGSLKRLAGLPPQLLLLVLESGDCVFLFVRPGADGDLEFVTHRHPSPSNRLVRPGFHLAVDPSSRYMALACPKDLFIVYELESRGTLNERHMRGQPLRPVRTFRPRVVNEVIHKMEFLYPRQSDPHHIVLLLIVVNNGRSRLVTYEWELGDDLQQVLAEEKTGHRMPPEHQMPSLIIPLTVRSAFFAISPSGIVVCKDVLQGPPTFEGFVIDHYDPSELHHGLDQPLWTAWTRPHRLSMYASNRDNIYLAREDGVVSFLDIDSENILGASVKVGNFEYNVNTAFASLFDEFTDILILGGESGPGAVWQVPPREQPKRLMTIPNWSPTVDFITSDEFSTCNQQVGAKGSSMVPWEQRPQGSFTKPDRIFATTGRGRTGTIVEYRYGLQASIGLELDYLSPIKHAWLFPSGLAGAEEGFHLLLSMPDRSAALYLPEDFSNATEPEPDALPYDLHSRTIAAGKLSDQVSIQITEQTVNLIMQSQSTRRSMSELLGVDEITVEDACFQDEFIALTTHTETRFQLHLLAVQDLRISLVHTYRLEGEATSLAISRINGVPSALVGLWRSGAPSLAIFGCDNAQSQASRVIGLERGTSAGHASGPAPASSLEAITSIVALDTDSGRTVLVAGTRSGDVASIGLSEVDGQGDVVYEKFGITPATVFAADSAGVFVCCDTSWVLMTDYGGKELGSFKTKHAVFAVDANDVRKSSPPIDSITVLEQSLSGNDDNKAMLLVAGSNILLAELQPQPGPVPRHLPIGDTPLKVVYSHSLDCLIVAVMADERPTIRFIDPESGEDLSRPSSKDGGPVPFVSGLGNAGDRIYGLAEWEYKKGANTWRFILVTTKQGRLLVLSAEKEPPGGGPGGVRYWTRFKKKGADMEPIYSVLGHADGVLFCSGTTIHWETLDTVERKLVPVRKFELGSPATSLRVFNGRLIALTSRDSVEIIDFTREGLPDQMVLAHVDPVVRRTSHLIEVAAGQQQQQQPQAEDGAQSSSVILLCDRESGVAGLWVPWQRPGDDCEVVFDAELPASIRRFRRGRTRPGWLQSRRPPRYGVVPSTEDGAEILGMCIDGSLWHFTILSADAWRLLRFVQNLALARRGAGAEAAGAPDGADADAGADAEPRPDRGPEMQVDGDLLQGVLAGRGLERLVEGHSERLVELLDAVDGGKWTAGLREAAGGAAPAGRYLDLAYAVLEYFLEPVL